MSVKVINAWGTFEDLDKSGGYLDNGSFAWYLEDLSFSDWAITEADVYDFCKLGELHIVKNDQRTINLDDSSVVDTRCDRVVPSDSLEIGVEELTFIHLILNILIWSLANPH